LAEKRISELDEKSIREPVLWSQSTPEYWNKRVKWEKNKIYETKPVNSDIEVSLYL
jgi:hypothetical protein